MANSRTSRFAARVARSICRPCWRQTGGANGADTERSVVKHRASSHEYQASVGLPWQNPKGGAHSPVARSRRLRPGDYRMRPGNETRGNGPSGRRARPFIFGGHRSTGLHRKHRRFLEPRGGLAPSGEKSSLHDCHRIRATGPCRYGDPTSVRWPLWCWPRPVHCGRRVELDRSSSQRQRRGLPQRRHWAASDRCVQRCRCRHHGRGRPCCVWRRAQGAADADARSSDARHTLHRSQLTSQYLPARPGQA
jgi:hypothetical protein